MPSVVTLGLEFATPLVLIAIVPVLALLMVQSWRPRNATPLSEATVLAAVARPTWRIRLRWLPDALRALAVILLIIAVARPREGLAVETLPEEGIDVVAVVDVSSSMRQSISVSESRLEAARRVLDEFAVTLEGDRLGLVVFQSRAFTFSPLTADIGAVRDRIEQLEPGIVPDGTAIGLGLAAGVTLLEESVARSRVVVMLTDGESNMGEIDPFTAARMADALGIRVYVVGLHSAFGRDEVDQRAMTALSELTGGAYFDARSAPDLASAYEAIGDLERSRLGEREFVAWRDFGPCMALAATVVLFMEIALRSTWLRRSP
ncbi:MAG: VWA domain-containing protein [Chloroflexi bacterium]|nr:VWA domain-containing protein [Chloroflexota bacterium]